MKVQVKEITKNFNDFEEVTESLNGEKDIFHSKEMERVKNGWKVRYVKSED